MQKTAPEIIREIEDEGFVEVLRERQTIMQRLDQLMEFAPETRFWDSMRARKLVYELQCKHNLDFGVCQFYSIEGDEQFCSADGKKHMCLCAIPEVYCVLRDKDSEPKYPEFGFIRILDGLKSWSF
ncbi:hypothetical protein KJ853_01665 [Patescibacteria group bacterium]|nr:hypothetical protein [Patescibacteria group bacterium]